jgi:hypothetical protein
MADNVGATAGSGSGSSVSARDGIWSQDTSGRFYEIFTEAQRAHGLLGSSTQTEDQACGSTPKQDQCTPEMQKARTDTATAGKSFHEVAQARDELQTAADENKDRGKILAAKDKLDKAVTAYEETTEPLPQDWAKTIRQQHTSQGDLDMNVKTSQANKVLEDGRRLTGFFGHGRDTAPPK